MRRSPRDPPRSAEIRRDPPGEAEGSDRRDRGEIRCRSTLGSSRTGSEACCRTRARGPAGGGRAARPGAVVPHRVCVVCWCIGTDLYRMKGVLNVQHATQKFVYHAVHMIFNGAAPHISPYLAHDLQRCSSVRHRLRREMQPSHPRPPPPLPPSSGEFEDWEPDEPRETKLVFGRREPGRRSSVVPIHTSRREQVFIGKNIDAAALKARRRNGLDLGQISTPAARRRRRGSTRGRAAAEGSCRFRACGARGGGPRPALRRSCSDPAAPPSSRRTLQLASRPRRTWRRSATRSASRLAPHQRSSHIHPRECLPPPPPPPPSLE